jgi:hypothetical protein
MLDENRDRIIGNENSSGALRSDLTNAQTDIATNAATGFANRGLIFQLESDMEGVVQNISDLADRMDVAENDINALVGRMTIVEAFNATTALTLSEHETRLDDQNTAIVTNTAAISTNATSIGELSTNVIPTLQTALDATTARVSTLETTTAGLQNDVINLQNIYARTYGDVILRLTVPTVVAHNAPIVFDAKTSNNNLINGMVHLGVPGFLDATENVGLELLIHAEFDTPLPPIPNLVGFGITDGVGVWQSFNSYGGIGGKVTADMAMSLNITPPQSLIMSMVCPAHTSWRCTLARVSIRIVT